MAVKKGVDKEVLAQQTEGQNGTFHGALTSMVENLLPDVEKFYEKGNRSAAARLRVGLQKIRKACKPWREGIQQKVVSNKG